MKTGQKLTMSIEQLNENDKALIVKMEPKGVQVHLSEVAILIFEIFTNYLMQSKHYGVLDAIHDIQIISDQVREAHEQIAKDVSKLEILKGKN